MSYTSRLLGPLTRARSEARRAFRRFDKQLRRERRVSPDDVGLPYEALALEATDGQELASWYVPGNSAVRVVGGQGLGLFVHHHYGGQKATVLPWLELFHFVGIDSLAIDARGHAASSHFVSEEAASFAARVADVHAGCDELVRRGARRLLLIGQSQGAAPVLAAAARRGDVAGVIVDSGPAAAMELATWGLAGQILGQRRPLLTRALLTLEIARSGNTNGYFEQLWSSVIALRDTPLLWIHADRDPVIPPSFAALWFHLCRPKDGRWTSLTISGEEHVHQPTQGSPLALAVLSFVQQLPA